MKSGLSIFGFAAAGAGTEFLPEARRVYFQEKASTRGGGRLPRLALELAQCALAGRAAPEETAVFFGTALGCLTETESFVAHMIRAEEATPKPRAFSFSVHNAIASFVALKLGARGECSTSVQGELSFAHSVLAAGFCAARREAPLVVGALDEAPPGTFADLARAAGQDARGEGGALWILGGAGCFPQPALARLESLTLARPEDSLAWARERLADSSVELLLHSPSTEVKPGPAPDRVGEIPVVAPIAHHPSSLATTTALALGLLTGEVSPEAFDLAHRPRALAVLGTSVFGEAALFCLQRD